MPKRSKAQKRRVQQKQKRKALNIRRANTSSPEPPLVEDEYNDFLNSHDPMEAIITAFHESQDWADEPEFADPIFELDEAVAIIQRADELITQNGMRTAAAATEDEKGDAIAQAINDLLEPHHKEAILAGLEALSQRWFNSSKKQADAIEVKMVYVTLHELEGNELWGACTLVIELVMRTLSSLDHLMTQLDELKEQATPLLDDAAGAPKLGAITEVMKSFAGKIMGLPKSKTDLNVFENMVEKAVEESGKETLEAILTGDLELALFTPEELLRQQERILEISEPHMEAIKGLDDISDVSDNASAKQIATAIVTYSVEAVQQICAVRGEEIKERINYMCDDISLTVPYAPYLISLKVDTSDEEWGTPSHHSLNALTKIYITEGQRYALQAKEKEGVLAEGAEG